MKKDVLTLIGMRGDTLISLSYLDQILSAEFLSNFLEMKIDINWVNLSPPKLIVSYQKYPKVVLKMIAHANEG